MLVSRTFSYAGGTVDSGFGCWLVKGERGGPTDEVHVGLRKNYTFFFLELFAESPPFS